MNRPSFISEKFPQLEIFEREGAYRYSIYNHPSPLGKVWAIVEVPSFGKRQGVGAAALLPSPLCLLHPQPDQEGSIQVFILTRECLSLVGSGIFHTEIWKNLSQRGDVFSPREIKEMLVYFRVSTERAAILPVET